MGGDGVAVDVSDGLEEVGVVIDGLALVAALEEVAFAACGATYAAA